MQTCEAQLQSVWIGLCGLECGILSLNNPSANYGEGSQRSCIQKYWAVEQIDPGPRSSDGAEADAGRDVSGSSLMKKILSIVLLASLEVDSVEKRSEEFFFPLRIPSLEE